MLKFFMNVMISFSVLSATQTQDICTQNMTKMFSSYYKAERLLHHKKLDQAKGYYEQSKEEAYQALENCQNNSNYDFNVMYSFIQESERRMSSF